MTLERGSRTYLIILSILVTTVIVLVGNAASAVVIDEPMVGGGSFGFIDAPDVAVMHFIFTGIPFFVLAAKGDRRRTMWVTAVVLVATLWGYVIWRTWQASLVDFAGGADIGLGFVMMAAPLAILLILKGVSLAQKGR